MFPAMKLYDSHLSPFSSRVRIVLYAKNLPHEQIKPPGGTGSAEYKRINPTGKVPALEHEGRVLPESAVICEYLEDLFPSPPLRPADARARAEMRVLAALPDLYLMPEVFPLLRNMSRKGRDDAAVAAAIASLGAGFDRLEQFLVADPHAAGADFTLADASIVPSTHFIARVLAFFEAFAPTASRPKLARVMEAAGKNAAAARVLGEMTAAMDERIPLRR
jgi:glutathione S-transferase